MVVPKGKINLFRTITQSWFRCSVPYIVDEEVFYDNGLFLNINKTEVIDIYDSGFYHDYDDDIIIPDGITKIRDLAFCGSLIKSVKFPRSLTSITEKAFAIDGHSHQFLKHIYVPTGCKKLYIEKLPNYQNIIEELTGSEE